VHDYQHLMEKIIVLLILRLIFLIERKQKKGIIAHLLDDLGAQLVMAVLWYMFEWVLVFLTLDLLSKLLLQELYHPN
jgi:hypothetical protein